jgi:hypothetical protein
MLDDLAGTKGAAKLKRGDDGNYYVDTPQLSRKGQWLKIAGEALHGAAAGAAHMQGPGAAGRGLAAGVEAGDKLAEQQQKQQKDVSDEARQKTQDNFNQIKLKMDMGAKEFELSRLKVKATDDDIKFAQEQTDRMMKLADEGKAFDLGSYKDEADLARVKGQNPNFWKDAHAGDITILPQIGPDGTRSGLRVFQTTPGVGNQQVAPGTAFKVFTPPAKPGDPPTLQDQVPTVPMTENQKHAYDLAAYGEMQKWQIDNSQEGLRASEAAKNNADAGKVPSEIRKNNAEAAKANREGEQDDQNAALVQDIVTGRVAPDTLGRSLGSKQGQALLDSVARADPNLDTSKLRAYPKVYQDFTSGKTATALNAGGTGLQHLAELKQLNTLTSRVPGSADSKAFNNKLDTLVPELIKFYGMPDTNESVRSLKSTLGGLMNRDAAISTQVKSLGDKMDSYHQQWRNAAPSASYQASMPNISDEAKMARAELDPKYANRLFSVKKWQAANPQGDGKAARAAAEKQGMDVIE